MASSKRKERGVFKRRYRLQDGTIKTAKNWSYEFYVDGQRYPGTLPNSGGLTERQAAKQCLALKEEKERELRGERVEGVPFLEGVEVYYQDYVRKVSERREETHKRVEDKYCYVVPRIVDRFGDKMLDGVTRQDIVQHIMRRRNEGVKDSTIRTDITFLSAMYHHCEAIGLCEHSAIPNFRSIKKLLKKETPDQRWLRPEEYDRLIEVAGQRKEAGGYLVNFIIFSVATGLRREETLSLRWQDVDLRRSKLLVVDTKNGKERTVHISAPAYEVLQQQQQQQSHEGIDSPYVFHGTAGRERMLDVKKSFGVARREAGLADVKIHHLRKTFGSWRLQGIRGKQLTLLEVSKALGHSSIKVTAESYAFLDELGIEW